MSKRGNVKEGDTVRLLVTSKLAIVKETNVDRDMEKPEDCESMVRLPEADSMVLVQFLWKKGGGTQYKDEPHHYMILNEKLCIKE